MRRLIAGLLLVAAAFACGTAPGTEPDDDGGNALADAGSGGSGGDSGTPNIRRISSLSIEPKSLSLSVGTIGGVSAIATFDDGTTSDISGTVEWIVSPPNVVDVSLLSMDDNLVKVQGLAAGTAQITARTGSVTSDACSVTVAAAQVADAGTTVRPEVRALWVTRFAYNTASDVQTLINNASKAGFNVIYFQVRGNGDAYYQSALLPWAQKLSGTLGKDPGWDPLQTAITAAHGKGMQLHAYWNVFAGWTTPAGCDTSTAGCTCSPTQGLTDSCTLPPASPAGKPNHMLHDHPEWMAVNANGKSADTEYYWFSPGNADVRAHIVAAADELLTNYAVDGLHLDRIRYEGTDYSHDAASEAAYAALPSPKPTWQDWERKNVSDTVAAIYAVMKQRRPNAVLSASVWGIYKPLPGCNTSQGYGNYYQDSVGWIKAGNIDALTPMIYWDIGSGCTDWAKLLDGFMAGANGRHIVAGMHALDSNTVQPAKIKARIEYARKVGAAGTSLFASSYLTTQAQWDSFKNPDGGVYLQDAGWPTMPWR
ncbi:MAG: glycoside hydrolase family 10 protein [Myxococcaceae bacterium]